MPEYLAVSSGILSCCKASHQHGNPMFSGLGYTEMMLFGIIALILFGSRLPEVARNFGRSYRDLRSKVDDFKREFRDWDRDDTPASPPSYTPAAHLEDDSTSDQVKPRAPKFTPPSEEE